MSDPNSDLRSFIRQVRARSRENREAMRLVFGEGLNSVAIGILRQELDSMVRVIYLLDPRNRSQRARLIRQVVSGDKWGVHDKTMVEFTVSFEEHYWPQRLYNFACGFIHLSSYHDYQDRDPFRTLPEEDRQAITEYLREYHPQEDGITADSEFRDIIPYVPKVLGKIAVRLEKLLDALEDDKDLSDVTL